MAKGNILQAAEELLKNSHLAAQKANKKFDGVLFADLWSGANKGAGNKGKADGLSDFYADLLQDPRFVNVGNNRWRLREFIPFDEFKKIKGAMYGIENLERVEEENRTKAFGGTKPVQEPDPKEEMIGVPTDDDEEVEQITIVADDEGEEGV